ncbi:MAG TPA: DUF2334 domain-containing protein [Polyangiales bacterium]|nr:DUF2334 domain-containing protein [Polyangiales bacterium]
MLSCIASVPELAAALPRLAAIGLDAAERHGATELPEATFAERTCRELRFDVIAIGSAAGALGGLSRVRESCRALLVRCDAASRPKLLAELGEDVLAAGDSRIMARGALRHPLIRIDDYPSGVRPIPLDLAPIHAVLAQFEARSLPYYLGIVPGLLDPEMLDFLASLRWMLPAQHGYDHRYPEFSARLVERGDPLNQRGTVGAFNEFRFARYGTVVSKLRAGRDLLQERLRKPVDTYIPPCNVCDRKTSRALQALGFQLCLSDKPVASRRVPVLRSDFYGRSSQAALDARMDTLCLHTNWEWDVAREGDAGALGRWIERVLELSNRKQRAIQTLAERLRAGRV